MQKMNQLLALLCETYNDRTFKPILESDVVAHMYHLWITLFENGNARRVHLSTRVYGAPNENEKFDFVIGEKTDSNLKGRTCISSPEIVAEVKFISGGGLDGSQRGSHYSTVSEHDFPKLNSIVGKAGSRYEVLFDPENFVADSAQTSRLRDVIANKNKLSPGVQLIHLREIGSRLEYKTLAT